METKQDRVIELWHKANALQAAGHILKSKEVRANAIELYRKLKTKKYSEV